MVRVGNGSRGRWGDVVDGAYEVVVVWWCCLCHASGQVGFGLKPEIERRVLGYGTPWGMAVGAMGDVVDGVYEVVVVWWCRIGSQAGSGRFWANTRNRA